MMVGATAVRIAPGRMVRVKKVSRPVKRAMSPTVHQNHPAVRQEGRTAKLWWTTTWSTRATTRA